MKIVILCGEQDRLVFLGKFKSREKAEEYLRYEMGKYGCHMSEFEAFEGEELEILPDGSLATKEVK